MKRWLSAILLVAIGFAAATAPTIQGSNVIKSIQDVAVAVKAPNARGSGVVITRTNLIDGKVTQYVWTAAHVVEGARHSTNGVVAFDTIGVLHSETVSNTPDGHIVGVMINMAKVIKYGANEDLALLQVISTNIADINTTFYLEPGWPTNKTSIFHVGSYRSYFLPGAFNCGHYTSKIAYIDAKVFDICAVEVHPGSSGGGVFLEDSRCVGLVLRQNGDDLALIVPVRRMMDWTKREHLEWALDVCAWMPSEDELDQIKVED